MLSKLLLLMTLSIAHVCVAMEVLQPTAEQEERARITAHRDRHQIVLDAARSGDINALERLLLSKGDNPAEHISTEYDARELFNAAYVNKKLAVMEFLMGVHSLPCPMDFSNTSLNIDYPHTTIPYPQREDSVIDSPNDIFAYNICSRAALCDIYTQIPNTDRSENNRWEFIFDFFKTAENAKRGELVDCVVQKAYLYNRSRRPQELKKWASFMREKACLKDSVVVPASLTLIAVKEGYSS
jgi:hypothetical protein